MKANVGKCLTATAKVLISVLPDSTSFSLLEHHIGGRSMSRVLQHRKSAKGQRSARCNTQSSGHVSSCQLEQRGPDGVVSRWSSTVSKARPSQSAAMVSCSYTSGVVESIMPPSCLRHTLSQRIALVPNRPSALASAPHFYRCSPL